jgi:recombinational DNA repair ATPase RecF
MNKKLTPVQELALSETKSEYKKALTEYNAACKKDNQAQISAAYDRLARAQSELATVRAKIAKP